MTRPNPIPELDAAVAIAMGWHVELRPRSKRNGDLVCYVMRYRSIGWYRFSPTSDANDRDVVVEHFTKRLRLTLVTSQHLSEAVFRSATGRVVGNAAATTPGEAVCRAVEAMEGK